MGDLDPDHEWMPRAEELMKSNHLRQQAKRAYKAYKIIHGTKDAASFKAFHIEVARLVALVEVTGKSTTACVGGVLVQRGPMEAYSIHLWSADVFVMHLADLRNDPKNMWDRAMELWNRGQKAS